MNLPPLLTSCAAAVASALFTALLVRVAPHVGLCDDGADARERKLQRRAVPLVGGVAVFGAWCAFEPLFGARETGTWTLAALGAAFVLGVVDDLAPRGLGAAAKLAGQLGVAALCALAVSHARVCTPFDVALAFVVALAALEAFNTFDNADGAASAYAAAGLASGAPLAAAAFAGFLPFNLVLRRADGHGGSTPRAYLGDAGAHLAGVFVALTPDAWPVLAVPLLDLARLVPLRLARGSKPWIGDRRHLAHRLQSRGFGPVAVVVALLAITAPAFVASAFQSVTPYALPAGLALTALAFVCAVRATPDVG